MLSHPLPAPTPATTRSHRAGARVDRARVAVLYSGRWFGTGNEIGWHTTEKWAQNHLKYLIEPNNASVFVVASPSNWCGPPGNARETASATLRDAAFQDEVRRAFGGWHDVHAALVPHQEGDPLDGATATGGVQAVQARLRQANMSDERRYGFITAMMRNWRWQYANFARAESLRRVHGPHDWVVRVRLDIQFVRGVPMVLHRPTVGNAHPLANEGAAGGPSRAWRVEDSAAVHASSVAQRHTLYAVGFHAFTPSLMREDTPKVSQCELDDPDERARGYVDTWTMEQLDAGHVPKCTATQSTEAGGGGGGGDSHGLTWHWRDWLFVGSPAAIEPLASMTSRLALMTGSQTRCFGLCQEEQTMLQMISCGVRYAPLGVRVELDRIPCSDGGLVASARRSHKPVGGYQKAIEPLEPTNPPWATPCLACVARPPSSQTTSSSDFLASKAAGTAEGAAAAATGRRMEESGRTLRRGAWLSTAHDATYGKQFKITEVGYWGASSTLVREVNARASRSLDVYEFGVYTGVTMRDMARRVHGFGHLYGFDSFMGLPNETRGEKLEGPHWKPGGFSAADAMGEWRLADLTDKLRTRIRYPNTTLVAGFYSDVLTSTLRSTHPFQPALLVDIDVDLHSSALECLTWLIEEKLLVAGTVVRYDDWRNINQRGGEARAHREVTKRYGITWRNLGKNGQRNSREWQVVSIG